MRIQRIPDGFIVPAQPVLASRPPSGPDWVHEIKHDGYRLMVWRDGERVRLFTRRGFDWTERYPWIVQAARKLRTARFMIDGEVVVCAEDGVSDFERLHSREHDASARRRSPPRPGADRLGDWHEARRGSEPAMETG